MARIKKIITAAVAALALTTASLAIPGQAFAGGGHGHGGHGSHGGHGGHGGGHGHHGHYGHHGHGHHGHGHHGHGHHFHVHNSCWKWTPYGSINVCYRY